jgi:hypothetical protein
MHPIFVSRWYSNRNGQQHAEDRGHAVGDADCDAVVFWGEDNDEHILLGTRYYSAVAAIFQWLAAECQLDADSISKKEEK